MPEKTEAQKRAQKKYMSSFVEIKVRMTPEKRSIIQDHARAMGESVTVFINRSIDQTMAQDAVESPAKPVEVGAISLPSETLETAQRAAEAAGEGLPQFISRAVKIQAQRDILSRRMEGGTPNE